MTRSPDQPSWGQAVTRGSKEIAWVWIFVPLMALLTWWLFSEGYDWSKMTPGQTDQVFALRRFSTWFGVIVMTIFSLVLTFSNIRSTRNRETPLEREARERREEAQRERDQYAEYLRLRGIYGALDDPDSGFIGTTDQGIMTLSQYVGITMAEVLRERGLWRPEGPLAVTDRLRDMAALSRGALDARRRFVEQIQKPDEERHHG